MQRTYNLSLIRDEYKQILSQNTSDKKQVLNTLDSLMFQLREITSNNENSYWKYIKMYLCTTNSLEHLQTFQTHPQLRNFPRLNQLGKDSLSIPQYMATINLGHANSYTANAICLDIENPHLLKNYIFLTVKDSDIDLRDIDNCVIYHLQCKQREIIPKIETVFYKTNEAQSEAAKKRKAEVSQEQLDMVLKKLIQNLETSRENKEKWLYTLQGRRVDEETGLMYFRNRYYSVDQGRFITRDPLGYGGGGMGLYEAFASNPICAVDPSGKSPKGNYGDYGLGSRYKDIVTLTRFEILKATIVLSDDSDSKVLPTYIREAALKAIKTIAAHKGRIPLFKNTSDKDFYHFHFASSTKKANEKAAILASMDLNDLYSSYDSYDQAVGTIDDLKAEKFTQSQIDNYINSKKDALNDSIAVFAKSYGEVIEDFLVRNDKGRITGTKDLEFQFHTYETSMESVGLKPGDFLRRPRFDVSNPCNLVFPKLTHHKKGTIEIDQYRYITSTKDGKTRGTIAQTGFFFTKDKDKANTYKLHFRVGFHAKEVGKVTNGHKAQK